MENPWLSFAKQIQAIAQAGITYAVNDYDMERYQQLRTISVDMLAQLTDLKVEKIRELFTNETGYQTPKVDVRGVVFKNHQLLLVKEKIDGCWSMPGGWADIGLSPREVVIKEVREEAGLEVKPVRLLAVLDKKCHPHPPSLHHTYKLFILCAIVGGKLTAGMETDAVQFFDRDKLPPLSLERNTTSQIELLYEFLENPDKETVFD